MYSLVFLTVWYGIFLLVRYIPWNIGCEFHIRLICSERQWRNTVCRCGWNGLPYILFSPVPCLSLFPVGRQAGQEKPAAQCPIAENSVRKMIACQKRKTRDVCVVSVLRFSVEDKAHSRNSRVPVPVRWYFHLCRLRNHTSVFTLNEGSVSSRNGDLYHRLIPCCLTGEYPKLYRKSAILICFAVCISIIRWVFE